MGSSGEHQDLGSRGWSGQSAEPGAAPPHCRGVTVQPPGLVTAHVRGSLSAYMSQVVSGGNHDRSPPLPSLPACARGGGEGPGSQEPHADAVRNIGFNELQNEAAAADMYGWCPHPPPTPPTHTHPAPWHCLPAPWCIFSRPWALLSLGSTPLTSRLVPGRTGAAHEPCVPTFSIQAPQVARLGGCSRRPHFPLCEEPESTVLQAGAQRGCMCVRQGPCPDGCVRPVCARRGRGVVRVRGGVPHRADVAL